MGRKKQRKKEDPGNASAFQVNPFADLDLPDLPQAPTEENENLGGQDVNETLNSGSVPDAASVPRPGAGMRLHFRIERKGRGGKIVTIVAGIQHLDILDQMELVRMLKKDLGIGGTIEDGALVLQGNVRERAVRWFAKHGWLSD